MTDEVETELSSKIKHFFNECSEFKSYIEENRSSLLKLLVKYETYDAANDEINRSIETLLGLKAEVLNIDKPFNDLLISTFFPLNLPLYSLILFGLAPSVFSKKVFIRPPEVMYDVLNELWEFLDINRRFPEVSLKLTPRNIFVQLYASESDVVIFTGKYLNALDVHRSCANSLLIYNGSGINPFILFENADVDLAVEKAIEMRCFNSGQDCAGPDAFFIPENIANEFTEKLIARLKDIKVGDTQNKETRIGATIKEGYITELTTWLQPRMNRVIYGGKIDFNKHLVYPTIVREKIASLSEDEFHEFFAPFFYILEYSSVEELEKTTLSNKFKEKTMYISVFGNNDSAIKKLGFAKVLKNQIVNDTEKGNEEYGGYGSHANFLLFKGKKDVHPILISRDIHKGLTY